MKDDYTTNSYYVTYTFLFEKAWENLHLELWSEGVKLQSFDNLKNITLERLV